MLDTIVGAFTTLPSVQLAELPAWPTMPGGGEAVGRALGWPPGLFRAHARQPHRSDRDRLADSPVASAIAERAAFGISLGRSAGHRCRSSAALVGDKVAASARWPETFAVSATSSPPGSPALVCMDSASTSTGGTASESHHRGVGAEAQLWIVVWSLRWKDGKDTERVDLDHACTRQRKGGMSCGSPTPHEVASEGLGQVFPIGREQAQPLTRPCRALADERQRQRVDASKVHDAQLTRLVAQVGRREQMVSR